MNSFNSKILNRLVWVTVFLMTFAFSSCEKCMRCSYYYKENYADSRYKQYEAEECGNEEDIQQFNEAMEFGASQYDTVPVCVSW